MTKTFGILVGIWLVFSPAPTPACSCSAYPGPFCSVDLDSIDQTNTVIFVGRATRAEGGIRDVMKQMRQQASDFVTPPGPETEKPGPVQSADDVVDATKRMYLEMYGDRLDPDQLSALRNAKSQQDIANLSVVIHFLGRPVEFEVVESFVGEFDRSVEIFTGHGGGDCGFDFQEGETYLIEAHRRDNGELHSWLCQSRVMPIEAAGEDLRTLHAWKDGEPLPPRVYGFVEDWTRRQGGRTRDYPAGAGVRLSLSAQDGKFQTEADTNGLFRFENLLPGAYRLRLEESGWEMINVSDGRDLIELSDRGCAELSVLIKQEQGRIRGRVLPQPGEGLPDYIWVEAISKEHDDTESFQATARAPGGAFELDEVKPGEYHIAINVSNTPSGPHHPSAQHGRIWPYPPTYYPGVADRQKAASLRVDRGQIIDLGDWMLPTRLLERRITGKALLPDGTAASDVRLILRRPGLKEPAELSGPTGDDGAFEVWPLESLPYLLEAASYDPKLQLVYRGRVEITGEEQGPLILQLSTTDEEPTDQQFFNHYNWKRN